jgi:hypothetical protein
MWTAVAEKLQTLKHPTRSISESRSHALKQTRSSGKTKRHGPHSKRRIQQFYYCCLCIPGHRNVFTQPLPSNDKRVHIQTQRLMGGIYELRRWDRLRCQDIYTKFHKDWFRHSNCNKMRIYRHRQHVDRISLLQFLQKYRNVKHVQNARKYLQWFLQKLHACYFHNTDKDRTAVKFPPAPTKNAVIRFHCSPCNPNFTSFSAFRNRRSIYGIIRWLCDQKS